MAGSTTANDARCGTTVASANCYPPSQPTKSIDCKIGQLEDSDRSLLVAASVQGDEFDAAVIAAATERDVLDVEDRLELLDRVHFLIRKTGELDLPNSMQSSHYQFVHVLYQNAFYSTLNPARRVPLNRAVAQALIDIYQDEAHKLAGELAFLFQKGREFELAAKFFYEAAKHAISVFAKDEALELLRRSIECAKKLKQDAQYDFIKRSLMTAGAVHRDSAEYDEALDVYDAAEQLAQQHGDKRAEVEAICSRCTVLQPSQQLEDMQHEAHRALRIAQTAGLDVGVSMAEAALAAQRNMTTGELAEREVFFERGVAALQQVKSEVFLSSAHWLTLNAAMFHTWRLEHDKARQVWELIMSDPEKVMGFFHTFRLWGEGMMLGNEGQISIALDVLVKCQRLAELNKDPYILSRLPNTIGWIHREICDWDTALRLEHENISIAKELGFVEPEANAHVNLGHDYLALGEPGKAIEHLRHAERLYGEEVWMRWRYNLRLQADLAKYWIVKGDLHQAGVYASATLDSAKKNCAPKYIAWGHKVLGDIAALEERMEDAQLQFGRAIAVVSGWCPTIEWKIFKSAGDLAGRMNDTIRRDKHLSQARSVVDSLAETIHNDHLRQQFLSADAVRDLNV